MFAWKPPVATTAALHSIVLVTPIVPVADGDAANLTRPVGVDAGRWASREDGAPAALEEITNGRDILLRPTCHAIASPPLEEPIIARAELDAKGSQPRNACLEVIHRNLCQLRFGVSYPIHER